MRRRRRLRRPGSAVVVSGVRGDCCGDGSCGVGRVRREEECLVAAAVAVAGMCGGWGGGGRRGDPAAR